MKTLLKLFAAALLVPTFAYAGMDRISTGPEGSGTHCDRAVTTELIAVIDKQPDPVENEINALVDSTDDPVLASYYRDLYHAPAPSRSMKFVWAPDAYEEAVHIALYGTTEPEARMVC